jgi:hydroxymethylpyrimidine/phosphomethylpyrimidine kinase
MVSKSGAVLLRDDAMPALVGLLLPLAEVVTPNLPEAARLAGLPTDTPQARREAARRIRALGPKCVVIKGGHAPEPGVVDLFYDGTGFTEIAGERVATRSTHGTGCTFSAALAAGLALGQSPIAAAARAQEYVIAALRAAPGIGLGAGPLGHFHGHGRH